ncbi:MAG TPA: class I SAM-dependent methyltransferase [Burkholderiales bacterium]|nr:class I SAM-dependent methyltransferase [Burkholderiales bacterium]
MTDLNAVKANQQKMWATGDFAMIAWNTVYPGEQLCEAAGLRAGESVLDVATGSGNVALSAARRNCEAHGVDYVPELIQRARERAAAERVPAVFEVGDCEAIPYGDKRFDAVLSLYGSMFAPDQEKAAAELVRVCRPGGRIAMGNWTPAGFWGQAFALVGRYLPPPAGVRPPSEWGTQKRLRELFGSSTSSLRIEERSALFRYRSSAHWIDVFSRYFGPIMRVLANVPEPKRGEFLRELDDTLNRFNKSGDGTLVVSADYLEVVAVKN